MLKLKIVQKECIKCGKMFPINEFPRYRNRKKVWAYNNRCKKCTAKYKNEHYENNKQPYLARSKNQKLKDPEGYKDYMAKYYYSNRETILEKNKKYNKTHAEQVRNRYKRYSHSDIGTFKNKCRRATHTAINNGELIKPTACSECGQSGINIEAHHLDYSDPLNVLWLCKTCHMSKHRLNRGQKFSQITANNL